MGSRSPVCSPAASRRCPGSSTPRIRPMPPATAIVHPADTAHYRCPHRNKTRPARMAALGGIQSSSVRECGPSFSRITLPWTTEPTPTTAPVPRSSSTARVPAPTGPATGAPRACQSGTCHWRTLLAWGGPPMSVQIPMPVEQKIDCDELLKIHQG